MRFLMMLLSAIKMAIFAVADFIFDCLFAPARLARPPGRSAVPPPPPAPEELRVAVQPAPRPTPRRMGPEPSAAQIEAVNVMALAAARIKRDASAAAASAPRLPEHVRTWVEALSVVELRLLLGSRVSGVIAHLVGESISGVRPFQPAPTIPASIASADVEETPGWRR